MTTSSTFSAAAEKLRNATPTNPREILKSHKNVTSSSITSFSCTKQSTKYIAFKHKASPKTLDYKKRNDVKNR